MIRENTAERWQRIFGMMARADVAQLRYALWIRWKGLDFSGESCAQTGIPEERGNNHAHSGGPTLDRVLSRIRIPSGSRVVDFGSGKGLATITLRSHFEHVLGVEMSSKLITSAQRNVEKLRLTEIEFVCSDASNVFDQLHGITHVYMFNPFPEPVMADVMNNLRRSLEMRHRRLTIVYKNPICHDVIVSSGFHETARLTPRYTHPFAIYENGLR